MILCGVEALFPEKSITPIERGGEGAEGGGDGGEGIGEMGETGSQNKLHPRGRL